VCAVIEFKCSGCQKTLKVKDAAAGKRGKCPNCQTVVSVPNASTPPPAAAVPSAPTAAVAAAPPSPPAAPAQAPVPPPIPAGPHAGQPSPTNPRSGLSVKVIVGFILSLVPVIPVIGSIVAIVLLHMGRGEIKRGERSDGGGLALAGLIIAYIVLPLTALGLVSAFFIQSEAEKQFHAEVQRSDISTIRMQLELVRFREGQFPRSLQELVDRGYLHSVPIDPASGEPYNYDPSTGEVSIPE
jgi:hypothetical protein